MIKIPDDEWNKILEAIAIEMKIKAKLLCPFDMGLLASSVNYRISDDTIILYSDMPYAEYMEFGKPPGPISKEEEKRIMEWAQRKHFSKAGQRGVVKKIREKGIEIGQNKVIETPIEIYNETEAVLNPLRNPNNTFRPFLRVGIHQTIPEIPKIIERSFK